MANSVKEKIYHHSPLFIQNAMISLQGSIFIRQRFKRRFPEHLANAKNCENLTAVSLKEMQLKKLNDFIVFSYKHSPYYRKLFDDNDINPQSVSSLTTLKHIPILEKETLRTQTDLIRSRCYNKKELYSVHTSGTTGTPISVGFTYNDMQNRMALLYRMLSRFGVKPFDRSVRFSGRTLFPRAENNKVFWRMNYPAKQLLMSSYNLKTENFDHYINKLKKFNPVMIDGYPSSIFILARYINSTGRQGEIKPKLIMTTAETLEDYQREEIKEAFGVCAIGNQYASSEGAPFITEDEYGDLVINMDSGIFEFVKPGTDIPAEEGEIGEMLVTSFTTHAYPLIRYRIGDTVLVGEEKLAKSMPMPIVGKIMGRQEDILYTPYRGYVGRLDTVFKASPSTIVETQIVQLSPTKIQLNVVPDLDSFKENDLSAIKNEILKRLGDVEIEVEYHKALPRGKNGKLRAVIGQKR